MGGIDVLFTNVLTYIFSKHKCLVFTTFNHDDYFKVASKLQHHGVTYRTKFTGRNKGEIGVERLGPTQYDLYVKKSEEHLASKAING